MVDVAVAINDDTVWFVAQEGQYYVHSTNIIWEGSVSSAAMADRGSRATPLLYDRPHLTR